jgi:ElaB/YqjD/DUF883 family membrane-anchored ribosome-binding protein
MSAAVTRLAPVMETARNLSSTIVDGVDTTKRALQQASDAVVEAYEDTVHTVKKNPVPALAITASVAIGIGLGAGLLLGRSWFGKKPLFRFFK